MQLNYRTVIVAALRGTVLISKFLFTVYLARVLTNEEFGLWFLVVSGVSYGVFLIGAEIYNITLRDYVHKKISSDTDGLSKQWLTFVVIYWIILFLASCFDFLQSDLPSRFVLICALLLVLEHSTQEIQRISIYKNNQIHANILLFIKSAGWMLPTALYATIQNTTISLTFILQSWLCGSGLALIYGIAVYLKLFRAMRIPAVRFDKGAIKYYTKILMPFWVLAFAIRTPVVLDRYLLELFSDRERLGIYGYYMTLGNGVQAMFDATILSNLIPLLLDNNINNCRLSMRKVIKQYLIYSLGFWILSLTGVFLAMPYIKMITNFPASDNSHMLFILIFLGQMIFSFAVLLQYGLYALRQDQDLNKGAVVYLMSSLFSFIILIPNYGNIGAALSLGISALVFLMVRFYQLRDVIS